MSTDLWSLPLKERRQLVPVPFLRDVSENDLIKQDARRARIEELDADIERIEGELSDIGTEIEELESERRRLEDDLDDLKEERGRL